VLDLAGDATKDSLAGKVAALVDPKQSPWGEFDSAEELKDHLRDNWSTYDNVYDAWENDGKLATLLKQKYQWIRHDKETYPEGATTFVCLRGL